MIKKKKKEKLLLNEVTLLKIGKIFESIIIPRAMLSIRESSLYFMGYAK